jgi:uncharacterized protein YndB with AHSA1/START domain
MGHVSTEVEIDAPPEEVWKVVADPRNLPKWDRHISNVEGIPPEGLDIGSDYTTDLQLMGVRGKVNAHVLEIKPPEYSKIELSGPILDAVVTTRVVPIDDHRSRLEHDVEYKVRVGGLGRLADKALEVSGGPGYLLRRGALAQKRQIEEG